MAPISLDIVTGRSNQMQKTPQLFAEARKENRSNLLEPEAMTVCTEYGIPVVRFQVATSKEEAARFARELGYPVFLKIVSPQVVHKSDVGGVVTHIADEEELVSAYDRILASVKERVPEAAVAGVLVEEMALPGTEVIVGSTKDPRFGSVLMFGLGGVLVEVLGDTTFRVPPITASDALEMVTEIKGHRVLEGIRGQPPADIQALVDMLLRVSALLGDHPEIKEIDLNPIVVYPKGAKAVDARIILE
jgi:acyl-CoA synthetase (NDP forming)